MSDDDSRRRALEKTLAGRFWLRFHMSLMLGVAFVCGALANHQLIDGSVEHAALRWMIALAVAYGAFFVAMRLRLAYVGARPIGGIDIGNALDSSNASGGGGGVFLMVAAPHLLTDVAFDAALTHGFGRGVRKASADSGWTGSVLAATWKPFVAVTVTIVIAGFAFEHYFPQMHTLGAAWRRHF